MRVDGFYQPERYITNLITVSESAHHTHDLATPVLPTSGRGRSEAAKARYQQECDAFYAAIRDLASTLEFQVSTRGWCYILENAGAITKGEFDKVERLLTEGRKSGALPLDICAEDSAREFDGLEEFDETTPEEAAGDVIAYLKTAHEDYTPISFWNDQRYYLQLVVKKLDLKSLFAGICQTFRIPHANARSWSDLHIRAGMMERFAHWEALGKQTVLLYCGDFDPVGLKISEVLRDNMAELSGAVGWSPDHVIIDCFGLNLDFINAQNLPWIDGLTTGSGQDLAKPSHKHHDHPFVQDYLRRYCTRNPDGTWRGRKVEANAMVVRPDESRALLRDAIPRYLPDDAPARYEERLRPYRERMRQEKLRQARAWVASEPS